MHIDDIRYALNPDPTLRHLAELVEAITCLNRTRNEADLLIGYFEAQGFAHTDARDLTVLTIAGVLYRNYTTMKDLQDPHHLEILHTDLTATSAATRI